MIRLLGKLPRRVTVAVSGGVDSMVLLDFLSRNHDIRAVFFNHGTDNSLRAQEFLTGELNIRGIPLMTGYLKSERRTDQSPEEFWREERYRYLDSLGSAETIVTAHTLDDAVETWIWSSLHGTSRLLPYRRNHVVRPLLLTQKQCLLDWAHRKGVKWVEDTSNQDMRYTRNYIRRELMPHALRVNPGIHTMIRRRLEERFENLDKSGVD